MNRNPNLDVVRRKVIEMGGHIIEVRNGARHIIVVIQNREGRQVRMHLSHYRIDEYLLEGWTRQALTRPERPVVRAVFDFTGDGYSEPKGDNDNEPDNEPDNQ
jgi:hypothetical protein